MVASNSRIMDMPIFPDDLVPKLLQGMSIPAGWFPYIHGICIDARGKPLMFYISIDFSFGGPKFAFLIQGQVYTGNFNKSVYSYANGVLIIGTKPKFVIDYHHPHKIRIDISSKMSIELDLTYRGPPLWYGKGTNPADMVGLTPTSFIGGYDAPCRIKGKVTSPAKPLSFSGYGEYGHIWLLGSFKWEETNSRWIVFNDSRSYGVATKTYDIKTGATLASTGRFGVEDGLAFTFDDFEWVDDNLQPPRFVIVKGQIQDLNRTTKARIDLRTIESVNLFIPSIWTQHRMAGTVDATTFDGSAWCETHKPFETSGSTCLMTKTAHRNPLTTELNVLTKIRDRYLPDKIAELHYKFSPQIAETARKHETLGLVVRTTLKLIIKALR
jgi:hypothetical protein